MKLIIGFTTWVGAFLISHFTWTQCTAYCDQSMANTFYGINNGGNNSGTHNTFFGITAGRDNTTGGSNSFFGAGAGLENTWGWDNSFYGFHAGLRNTTGIVNTFVGSNSGKSNTTGSSNSFFGEGSGTSNTTGSHNSFFGSSAGKNTNGINFPGVELGSNNSFFGSSAGLSNNSGSNNSFFGRNTGASNTTGNSNSFFGNFAGNNNTNGNRNSYYGAGAGKYLNGSGNIAFGNDAGPLIFDNDLSNRLFIDNHETNDPLIYGELDSHFVRINGTFEVTAGLSNPSSCHLKTDFEEVNKQEILDKIQDLDVTQWIYKDRPNEPHVGPMAEDFYAAFGLGAGDEYISTIDADGVMMLAIQALLEKVEEQSIQIRELEKLQKTK